MRGTRKRPPMENDMTLSQAIAAHRAHIQADAERCAYCGAPAIAVNGSDFLVCSGHSDMRNDVWLRPSNRPVAGERHSPCGRMVAYGGALLHEC
jgi:hypothetical protein